MSNDHPFGKPIRLLNFTDTNQVDAEQEEFDQIFSNPEIQDRKVVIFSLIGAFRGGKSFFLDYCLRFLYANFSSINCPRTKDNLLFERNDDWMGNPDDPLTGFSWRSGTRRDTTGIIMWSDVFLHTMEKTGEKIAIFVMDTQGLFDNDTTSTDNAKVFKLTTMMSSIQVLNLMKRAQEDQLQYLQFAIEFAQFAVENNNEKPFQNLTFLIRDWANANEFKYGSDGGRGYINQILNSNQGQEELRSVRETIFNCFEHIECCLLPYPGRTVAGRAGYNGCMSPMNDVFKIELKAFVESLLLPERMTLKKINSKAVTVQEFKQYKQSLLTLFKSEDTPIALTMYEMTIKNHMTNLIEKCLDDYKKAFFLNEDFIIEETASHVHDKCKERALKLYDDEKKMGTTEEIEEFKIELEEKIESSFTNYKVLNDQRLKELEEERVKQHAAFEKEKQLRLQTEKDLREIELKYETLRAQQGQKTSVEYENQRLILEARQQSERRKQEEYAKRENKESQFRQMLIYILNGVILALAAVSPEQFNKKVEALKMLLDDLTKALDDVERTANTVREITKACSIL